MQTRRGCTPARGRAEVLAVAVAVVAAAAMAGVGVRAEVVAGTYSGDDSLVMLGEFAFDTSDMDVALNVSRPLK